MKRVRLGAALAVSALLLTAGVSADVTMQQKTQVKFEGMIGRMMNVFGGKAAKDGLVQTVMVQGDRKATRGDDRGEIVDLAEEKVYELNFKDKSYRVQTFAEIRAEMEEQARKAKEQAGKSERGDQREMQVDFDMKDTGQKRTINSYDCREVVTTITVHEKGKSLEQAGGVVMTVNSWLAPNVPGAKEVADFDLRYAKKLMGDAASARQMVQAFAMFPGMKDAMDKFQREQVKVDGTAIESTMTMAAAATPEQQAQQASREETPSGGGGLVGGMLGRFGRKKAEPKETKAAAVPGRSTIMTSTSETLSVQTSVNAADLQVPAGFKLKN